MEKKKLQILLVIVYCGFYIPYFAKQANPELFGSSAIQRSSLVILDILSPIGFLGSLSLLLGSHRRIGFLYLILFIMPPLFCIFIWGINPTLIAKAMTIVQPQYKELDIIRKLVNFTHDPNIPPEKRFKAATVLYKMWGIDPVVLTTNGTMIVYAPTEKEKNSLQKKIADHAEIEKDLAIMRWQLTQTPWAFGISILTMTIVFFTGLGFYVFRRPETS
jgi:hypothetical protein